MIVLLSGGFLWQWSMATTVQESGKVGGTTYGPLSQSHEVKTAYPDTVLTVHCKSVQAVQVWILTKENFGGWEKGVEATSPLAEDLGSDVTLTVDLKAPGTYVVVIGKAAGYIVTSYNVKIITSGHPTRIHGWMLLFGGAVTLVLGIVGLIRHKSTLKQMKGETSSPLTEKRRRSTGLRGSFPLDERTINKEVSGVSPGVYVLGPKKGETFYVHFVGRADTDVNAQLKEYIGKYDRFKFDTSDTLETAFIKECQLYHDFQGPEGRLDNKNHPERPQGTTWQCPKCNVYYSQNAASTMDQPP